VAISLITSITTLATAVFAGIMALKMSQAARHVEEVKDTLATNTKVLERKADAGLVMATATHTLVNGNTTAQLELIRLMARQIADDKKTPDTIRAAEVAEVNYQAHLRGLAAAEHRTKVDEEANAKLQVGHSSEPVS